MGGDGKKCGYPLAEQRGANVEKTALRDPECHEASGIKRECRIAEQQDTTVADQIEGIPEQRTLQSGSDVPLWQAKHGVMSLPP